MKKNEPLSQKGVRPLIEFWTCVIIVYRLSSTNLNSFLRALWLSNLERLVTTSKSSQQNGFKLPVRKFNIFHIWAVKKAYSYWVVWNILYELHIVLVADKVLSNGAATAIHEVEQCCASCKMFVEAYFLWCAIFLWIWIACSIRPRWSWN